MVLLPPGPTVFDTGSVVDIAVIEEIRPDVFDYHAVVAMVLLFVRGQADSATLVLKDIGGWRTIVWGLGSLGSVHPPCYAALSFCLDVRQIKGLEMVIGPRWADDILSLQYINIRWTPVGVIALRKPRSW